MARTVDGFELTFTGRTTWKAERRDRGKLVDVIPVAWADDYRRSPGGDGWLLTIWYRKIADLEAALAARAPIIVALAQKQERDGKVTVKAFSGVFEVVPTGARPAYDCIETQVVRRIKSGDENA